MPYYIHDACDGRSFNLYGDFNRLEVRARAQPNATVPIDQVLRLVFAADARGDFIARDFDLMVRGVDKRSTARQQGDTASIP